MTESATGPAGGEARFRRRRFLAGAAAGAAALALPAWLRPRRGPGVDLAAAAVVEPYRRPLRIPTVLAGSDLTIPIRRARLQILPGRRTRMWTYGGTFPGPTVRRPAGQATRVKFRHRLGRAAGELSVHLHGGHTPSADDGQPGGLTTLQPRSAYCDISPGLSAAEAGSDLLIAPDGERLYTYPGAEDGAPERAAFQWYHDHRLDRTGENVWRGLAGMWIIDDALDSALPLPRGRHDLPLLICDRAFNRRNQLKDPFGPGLRPPFDQVTGNQILVNGVILPYHRVEARRYRLRILNASNFRAYNLYLTGGVEIVQIATEAGLMPAPLPRERVFLGPGERAELVVDFAGARGRRIELRSGPRSDGVSELGSEPYRGRVMQFRVDSEPVTDTSSVPAALRALPSWTAGLGFGPAAPAPEHVWRVELSSGLPARWLINGRTFDPAHAEVKPRLGKVAVWEIRNLTKVGHMMHPHATDWLCLARNGKAPPPWERCLKETFLLDPGESIVIAGKLSDHLGKFVLHCHMLDHEDHGLMSQFEVVAP